MITDINEEWVNEILKDKNMSKDEESNSIDWVQNNRGFKKELVFKAVPANSKENKIFSYVVATHWNLGPEKNKRFLCPEQTLHLKKLGIKCPICEAKRKLLSMGFKEEDLCTQGKFGPISVFDPNITSNAKVVVLQSDTVQNWDRAHISILQQKGSFLTTWFVQRSQDPDSPDFLAWENSNPFKFTRATENGKWERGFSFRNYNFSDEVLAKLKEENENLTLPDLWKAPSDADILAAQDMADKMVQEYLDARDAIADATSTNIDDDVPF